MVHTYADSDEETLHLNCPGGHALILTLAGACNMINCGRENRLSTGDRCPVNHFCFWCGKVQNGDTQRCPNWDCRKAPCAKD